MSHYAFQSNGKHVISQSNLSISVVAMDSSLTLTQISGFPGGVNGLEDNYDAGHAPIGCTFNNNAIFAGGGTTNADDYSNYVKRWDQSLTRLNMTSLTAKSVEMGHAANNAYAIFSAGSIIYKQDYKFNCFSSTFTRSNITNPYLSIVGDKAVYRQLAIGVGDNAVFAGGYSPSTSSYCFNSVLNITRNLTIESLENLTSARCFYQGAEGGDHAGWVGKYLLFAGGRAAGMNTTYLNTVEVYQVN